MAQQTNGSSVSAAPTKKDHFQDMQQKVTSIDAINETDAVERVTEEIESLCMNCHEDGVTRLLLTRIPSFREIIIMSFTCPHCGFHNNEVQSAGQIQPTGAKFAFNVENEEDMSRLVVKSDTCVFRIENMDLEIPAGKGQYSNIEGILSGIRDDLESHQDERMKQMPELGEKVATVITTLTEMLEGKKFPFMVSADDPSGNSGIEPKPGDAAGKWAKSEYARSAEQNAQLGLGEESTQQESAQETEYHATNMVPSLPTNGEPTSNNVDNPEDDIVENQIYSFPASCPGCTKPCTTNMKMVNIPHFKQVVLMSTVCEHCGYRSNEVKTGGEVPEKGRKITLQVRTKEDLARDILKSESAVLECPELQLRVEPGTMGGRFTTVEGILTQIRRDLRAQAFGLEDGDADASTSGGGDSMTEQSKQAWDTFFNDLSEAIEGKKPFTLVLEDPLASSYVQSLTAPEPDPQVQVEDYDRTEEEEEELGLKDMRTEGYEEST